MALLWLTISIYRLLTAPVNMDTGEQQLVLTDSKYRYYSTCMERALRGFENTHEWADLISALTKINKVGFVGSMRMLFMQFNLLIKICYP